MQNTYHIIGLMSGTSLDGLDLAFCRFDRHASGWRFEIEAAQSRAYQHEWIDKLTTLPTATALELAQAHVDYGHLLGRLANQFITQHAFTGIDAIASHGHTIFHQPEKQLTLQIGDGAAIAAETGCNVVADFRTLDVAHGGQGAPLVPIGDVLLFGEYDACLNLGGFGNISYGQRNNRIAFDTCPANIVLNELAQRLHQDYDAGGQLARSGSLIPAMLEQLNALPYFAAQPPKSLGREWVETAVQPILTAHSAPVENLLHTVVEHIAVQIGAAAPKSGKLLVTGGGAFNDFLVERIRAHTQMEVVIPDRQVIEFKEALIFAFLGLLRLEGEINCLSSVTGASKDVCGGSVFHGKGN